MYVRIAHACRNPCMDAYMSVCISACRLSSLSHCGVIVNSQLQNFRHPCYEFRPSLRVYCHNGSGSRTAVSSCSHLVLTLKNHSTMPPGPGRRSTVTEVAQRIIPALALGRKSLLTHASQHLPVTSTTLCELGERERERERAAAQQSTDSRMNVTETMHAYLQTERDKREAKSDDEVVVVEPTSRSPTPSAPYHLAAQRAA